MTIKYLLDAAGGFTAGDTATGYTAYSFPSSHHATSAKRNAEKTARSMLSVESTSRKWTPLYITEPYDACNWAKLNRGGV